MASIGIKDGLRVSSGAKNNSVMHILVGDFKAKVCLSFANNSTMLGLY